MINGKKVLAIIPARAGSKRVKNKNLKILGNIPLIGWTLKDLNCSKYIDRAFVSTDSIEIQKIASQYGVDCDPLRAPNLSSDTATSVDVVLDIIDNVKPGYDIIVLLQPTSPLRKLVDIDSAIELFIEKNASSVISVCPAETHPTWTSPLYEDISMKYFYERIQLKRSQDLELYYRLNGAIYIIDFNQVKMHKSFFTPENSYAYKMNKNESIDIDVEDDFFLAEALINASSLKLNIISN